MLCNHSKQVAAEFSYKLEHVSKLLSLLSCILTYSCASIFNDIFINVQMNYAFPFSSFLQVNSFTLDLMHDHLPLATSKCPLLFNVLSSTIFFEEF